MLRFALRQALVTLMLLTPALAGGCGGPPTVLGPERLAWLLIELAAAETRADELDAALGHLDEALEFRHDPAMFE